MCARSKTITSKYGPNLSQMHRIYSCTSLTIVAADGIDADYRLRGFEGHTAPRDVTQDCDRLVTPETLVSVDPPREECPSNYNKRAWTFQERFLSRRKLEFRHGCIHRRCKELTLEEHELRGKVETYMYGDYPMISSKRAHLT